MGSKTRRSLTHANDHDIIRAMTSIVTRKIISLSRTMSVMIHRATIVMNGDEFDNVLQV